MHFDQDSDLKCQMNLVGEDEHEDRKGGQSYQKGKKRLEAAEEG